MSADRGPRAADGGGATAAVAASSGGQDGVHAVGGTGALCDWTIVLTNVSATLLSVVEVLAVLRLRWQME